MASPRGKKKIQRISSRDFSISQLWALNNVVLRDQINPHSTPKQCRFGALQGKLKYLLGFFLKKRNKKLKLKIGRLQHLNSHNKMTLKKKKERLAINK